MTRQDQTMSSACYAEILSRAQTKLALDAVQANTLADRVTYNPLMKAVVPEMAWGRDFAKSLGLVPKTPQQAARPSMPAARPMPVTVPPQAKIAASTIDREVAAGRARYEDVLPAAWREGVPAKEMKARYRQYVHDAAEHPDIARHRKLNAHLLEAQLAQPSIAAGVPNVTATKVRTRDSATYASPGYARGEPLHIEYNPRAGQISRLPYAAEWHLRNPARMPAAAPVDASLGLGVLQHEFGEAQALRSAKLHPYSSHAGVEPYLRQAMALRQDPLAARIFAEQGGDSDMLIDQAHRRMGGTSSNPVQPGTRRARALEREWERMIPQFAPADRKGMITDFLRTQQAPAGTAPTVAGIPEELRAAIMQSGAVAPTTPVKKALPGARVPSSLRGLQGTAKDLARKFIRAGKLGSASSFDLGACRALRLLGLEKFASPMRFETPEDYAEHRQYQQIGTAGGGLIGALAGAKAQAGKGLPAMLGGTALGAITGAVGGRGLVDLAHDLPERAMRPQNDLRERFRVASGGTMRTASTLAAVGAGGKSMIPAAEGQPSADTFAQFAQDDAPASAQGPDMLAHELDREKHEQDPGWGHTSSLEAQDVGTRTMELGLPSYSGV